MKKSAKLVTGKAVKCQAPKVHKCRNEARYLQGHKVDLPEDVQKLLDESSCHKQGKLINDIVVKNSSGKWCFKLDGPYLQESLRAEFVRWSPMSAWACMHWHRWTQNHSNPPSHTTTAIVAGT